MAQGSGEGLNGVDGVQDGGGGCQEVQGTKAGQQQGSLREKIGW